jgi:hypothetical protein
VIITENSDQPAVCPAAPKRAAFAQFFASDHGNFLHRHQPVAALEAMQNTTTKTMR